VDLNADTVFRPMLLIVKPTRAVADVLVANTTHSLMSRSTTMIANRAHSFLMSIIE
jgi:hypothetical protein